MVQSERIAFRFDDLRGRPRLTGFRDVLGCYHNWRIHNQATLVSRTCMELFLGLEYYRS